jgi:hypothetical protein
MRSLGRWSGRAAVILGVLATLGCASVSVGPDLGGLYTRAARAGDAVRNPVIVIPGILGSRLEDGATGRTVWGAFGGGAASPERADGASLLALPLGEGIPLEALRDGVRPNGVLDRVRVSLFGDRGWGLAAPSGDRVLAWLLPGVAEPAARRRIALDHLRKALGRARQFHAALDRPAVPPPGLALHLFAGDAKPTPAVVAVDRAGKLTVRQVAPGDGTVLRTSAVLDERLGRAWTPELVSPIPWRDVTFVFSDHLAMTRDPAFSDNILFRLLESPR